MSVPGTNSPTPERVATSSLAACALLLSLLTGCSGTSVEDSQPPILTAIDDARKEAEQADLERRRAEAKARAEASASEPENLSDTPAGGSYRVLFQTTAGDFTVEVYREWAPIGADHFYELVKSNFYQDAGFFRVVPNFMVQFGIAADPQVNAKWDRNLIDDPVKKSNQRGFITYAKTGAPNSRSTQVFINYSDNSFLDSQGFAPFGRVIDGMNVVDSINPEYQEQPDQEAIQNRGNAYLKPAFPNLDYIKSATILEDETPATE